MGALKQLNKHVNSKLRNVPYHIFKPWKKENTAWKEHQEMILVFVCRIMGTKLRLDTKLESTDLSDRPCPGGESWGIIGQNPSVSKSNWLCVVIFSGLASLV